MDGFLGLIIVIIYLFVAASGSKKKAKKKRKPQRMPKAADFAGAFSHAEPSRDAGVHRAERAEADKVCAAQRIHLHEIEPDAFEAAGEGEDPCHAGGAPDVQQPADAFELGEQHTEQNLLAQEILRGVVISEILTRPCDRAALRRNRRSAV